MRDLSPIFRLAKGLRFDRDERSGCAIARCVLSQPRSDRRRATKSPGALGERTMLPRTTRDLASHSIASQLAGRGDQLVIDQFMIEARHARAPVGGLSAKQQCAKCWSPVVATLANFEGIF
jgi:hypothetical protein